MRRILGAFILVVAAMLGATAPAQAGVWGTLTNDTDWGFSAGRFGRGGASCPTWNGDGGNTYRNTTFTCEETSVGPRTTTGYWFDVDGFTVKYLGFPYTVCFPTGPCRNIPSGVYTRIHDWEIARCSGYRPVCTVTWK
ncbi:hypothetical protein LFM09_17770 [Lentzea alba]|uniref:hypothetical protein n=1 Tax=Lentzea alba TaxID=2714351 RepID=UPI0039BFFB46